MASNNEDKFMRIDDEEIRFWIRKLGTPTITNHNILNDMINEIPAFLHYLTTMPEPDFTKSRMVLTSNQIKNEWLDQVKKESKSGLYKELIILITAWFDNNNETALNATPTDLKEEWFRNDHNISRSYIIRVLKNEFGMVASDPRKYRAFNNSTVEGSTGRYYTFKREDFTNEIPEDDRPDF